ncbi:MAG: methionine--tRNA ligase [Microscillaceae bacterium]|nr:methionine--tRNA ligase [Microscillaceae bacterium]
MSITQFKRYTVTSALPYANGPIHIGHMAGVYIPADIYVRYLRSMERDVMFIGGSDEHGVPVTIRAEQEGVTVQAVIDRYHEMIKKSFEDFGISLDVYSRTSREVHHETASGFFKTLYEKGIFDEIVTDQYYDQEKNTFLADRYIQGTCPNCGNPDAYGDQCERCGTSLSPDELINPRSRLSNTALIKKPTKHWYLPLDKYQSELESWIKSHENDWKPNVFGQCMSWINQGLHARSMTRDLNWGIPVPLPDAEGKVLYVWFDAPIGYISATKEYFAEKAEQDSNCSPDDWKKYWQSKDSKLVHFIGKDNIVFHCVIFPLILKLHGDYILPDNVPANEFMNLENNKISTSRNWAVWLHEYMLDFPDKQDVLRYVLTANAPDTKDSDFTWKDFQTRNNSELAGNLGNFVRRPIALTHKHFAGQVPPRADLQTVDLELVEELKTFPDKIAEAIEQFKFREALALVMELSRLGNQYIQKTEPWTLFKQDPENSLPRIGTILNLGNQIIANLAIVCEPFLPNTSLKIKQMLNVEKLLWADAGGIDLVKPGQRINQEEILFDKIEDSAVEAQLQKLENTKKANEMASKTAEPMKSEIVFDDFVKIDIRVATIKAAEKVKKSNKLLKLTLDTGLDVRTVLSGIAKYYNPEEIIGLQVCLVANLAPRPMMGEVSHGMVLLAEDKDGTLKFVRPETLVSNGSTVQ